MVTNTHMDVLTRFKLDVSRGNNIPQDELKIFNNLVYVPLYKLPSCEAGIGVRFVNLPEWNAREKVYEGGQYSLFGVAIKGGVTELQKINHSCRAEGPYLEALMAMGNILNLNSVEPDNRLFYQLIAPTLNTLSTVEKRAGIADSPLHSRFFYLLNKDLIGALNTIKRGKYSVLGAQAFSTALTLRNLLNMELSGGEENTIISLFDNEGYLNLMYEIEKIKDHPHLQRDTSGEWHMDSRMAKISNSLQNLAHNSDTYTVIVPSTASNGAIRFRLDKTSDFPVQGSDEFLYLTAPAVVAVDETLQCTAGSTFVTPEIDPVALRQVQANGVYNPEIDNPFITPESCDNELTRILQNGYYNPDVDNPELSFEENQALENIVCQNVRAVSLVPQVSLPFENKQVPRAVLEDIRRYIGEEVISHSIVENIKNRIITNREALLNGNSA